MRDKNLLSDRDLEPPVRQEASISTQRYSKKDLDHRSVISRLERTCSPPPSWTLGYSLSHVVFGISAGGRAEEETL